MEPSSSGFIYKTVPAPKAQGTLQKREQKDCKSQGIRECAVRVCLLVMSEATPIKSHQHGCLNMSQTRITTKGIPKQAGKTPQASIRHKNFRPLKDAKSVSNSLPQRRSTPTGYSIPNGQP